VIRRHLVPAVVAAMLLVIGGGALSGALGDGPFVVDVARGAVVGAAVLLGAIVVLVVRSADGRGVAASQVEAEPDSVERQVWRDAGSRTCADAVGILVFVALLCLWSPSPGLARWLPALGLLAVVVDLAVRARLSWLRRVPRDA
jgi:hypothetical protein